MNDSKKAEIIEIVPKRKRKKKSKLPAILIAAAICLGICAAGYYYGDSIMPHSGNDGSEISYAGYADGTYAELDDSLVIASSRGIQVIGRDGAATYSDSFNMASPAAKTCGDYAVAYDVGGTAVKVFMYDGAVYSPSCEESVISACVNKKGYSAVCTQCDGYNGHVTVYDADGNAKFEWFSGESFVLSAAISPDSSTLAVLGMTADGSRVVTFNIASDVEKGRYEMPGTVFFDISFDSKNEISLIAQDRFVTISSDGKEKYEYVFSPRYLKCCDMQTHTVVLSDYQTGGSCDIVRLKNGKMKTVVTGIPEAYRISVKNSRTAVLTGNDIRVYSVFGKEKAVFPSVAGAYDAIICSDGAVLAPKTFSAMILR